MPGFSGIHLAYQTLLSNQLAMEVVQHNIANVNTPGYHRQEAVLTQSPPQSQEIFYPSSLPGQMGTGVIIDRIRRFNLEFIDARYRGENADYSRWNMESEFVGQVETSLGDSGSNSLTTQLDSFWAGWKALSTDPEEPALRADLLETSKNLASTIKNRWFQLYDQRKSMDLSIVERVTEINEAASKIGDLNSEIARVLAMGDQPNDLQDMRDELLNKLSVLSGAVSHAEPNGQVTVSIGGHSLVIGAKTFKLDTATDPNPPYDGNTKITWESGIDFAPQSGEIVGLLDARDNVMKDQMTRLDTLANGLITRVNAIHQTAYGLNEAAAIDPVTGLPIPPGRDFFTGTSAQDIGVNAALDNTDLIGTAGSPSSPGDSSKALELFNVQSESMAALGNRTINQYEGERVAKLALTVRTATSFSDDHKNIMDSVKAHMDSISGVNLDEEAAKMVMYQRSYQAASRVMTAVDEMLDKLINDTGLVGR